MSSQIQRCPCRCHGQSSTFGACSVHGGCGHLHHGHDVDDPSLLCYRGTSCTDTRKRTATNRDGSTSRVRVPARATAPGLLCRMDTTMTRVAIEQLPMDYLELSTILGKTTNIELPASGSCELPVPIRLGINALAAAILDELERWAEVVADDAGFWYYPSGSQHERLRYSVGWILGRYQRFLVLPAAWHHRLDPTDPLVSGKDSSTYALESGLDGALRLLALHEQTTAVAGRLHRAERLQAPCQKCQRRALEHDEGSSHVECRRCGDRMPLKTYDQLASILARTHEGDLRRRPDSVPVAAPAADPPIVWTDGTRHTRQDARSNMMVTYLARYDSTEPAAAENCA